MQDEGVQFAWLCFAVAPWTGGDAAPAPMISPPTTKPWRLTACAWSQGLAIAVHWRSLVRRAPREVWYDVTHPPAGCTGCVALHTRSGDGHDP